MRNKLAFLFLIFAVSLFARMQPDVLFYLQDAGETYALLPVIHELKDRGADIQILAAGVAEEAVIKSGIPRNQVLTFKDLGTEAVVDRNWGRDKKISENDLSKILDQVIPKQVVTGVAFETQGQILETFRKLGVPTFAFWDNFNFEGENSYFQTAHSVEEKAETLLLPSLTLERAFEHRTSKRVVGQPTLETWATELSSVNTRELREKLGIDSEQKVALFIGGYGEDYEEAYRLFLEGASQASDYLFLIQPHPKMRGIFERSFALPNHFRLLDGEATTIEAAALSDLVICHQSTVAFQALAAQKPVIHVIPPTQNFDSIPLQQGLAMKVSRAEDLHPAIRKATQTPPGDFYQLLGVPKNGTEIFCEIILEGLKMHNLTYTKPKCSLEETVSQIHDKIVKRGDLPYATVARQLELLDQMAQFELGRFLLQNHCGLNGYWTYYLLNSTQAVDHPMEQFLMFRAPVMKANHERYKTFRETIQKELRDGATLASIPCGLMGDLLHLDYSSLKQFKLVGIDLDPESIQQAEKLAKERGLNKHVHFMTADAWKFEAKAEYDLITSNGLNFYEPNDDKVVELYRKFYQSLKPGGLLVTSFVTPPPGVHNRCEWKMDKISLEDALLQKIIAADMLEARWQSFRSTDQTRQQLEKAGFSDLQFLPDTAHLFPTVLARKPR